MAAVALHNNGFPAVDRVSGVVLCDTYHHKEGHQFGPTNHSIHFGLICIAYVIQSSSKLRIRTHPNKLDLTISFSHQNSLRTFLVIMCYLWACVFSLFQIIFIVNSKEYRSLYGQNPLKSPPKQINKPQKTAKIERVKFFPSPNFNKETEKLKSSPKIDKYDRHPFAIAKSQRIQNEYNEMRRHYLNRSQYESKFWWEKNKSNINSWVITST